jgi:ankyrin repeat protein
MTQRTHKNKLVCEEENEQKVNIGEMEGVLRRLSFSNIKRKLSQQQTTTTTTTTTTNSEDTTAASSGHHSPRSPSSSRNHHHHSPRSSKKKQSILDITPQWIKDLQKIKGRGANDPPFPTFTEITFSPANPEASFLADTIRSRDFRELVNSIDFDTTEVEEDDSEGTSSEEVEVLTTNVYYSDDILERVVSDPDQTLGGKLFGLCSIPNDRGLEMLQTLIDEQLQNNISSIRGPNNVTLLHVASRANNVQCINFLVQNCGADVNCVDSMCSTPLHHACSNGSRDTVLYLLSNKASVAARDQYNCFPLLICMRNNYKSVMKLLVEYGKADVHQKTKLGDTCLHIAAREGYLKRFKFLINECKASIHRTNDNNETVLFGALKNRSITQIVCNQISNFESLCRYVSVTNRYGKTVFHEACESGALEGILVLIQELKRKGIQDTGTPRAAEEFLWEKLNEYDTKKGFAPIHFAVVGGHIKLVKYLALSAQVDIDKKDNKLKNTGLHYAIKAKHAEICDVLTQQGKANLRSRNANRESCKRLSLKLGIQLHESEDDSNKRRRKSLGHTVRRVTNILL